MRVNNKKIFAVIRNILGLFPLLLILAMFILHLALPDKTFSKEERRYLAQWPAFHIERVLNGSYETKVESYFSDQFPLRNFWVHIQEGTNQILFEMKPIGFPRR
ncbi:MAG: DHHW family protein [Dehalobacterium sp.]